MMIQEYIDKFQEIKPKLLKSFEKGQPSNYGDILAQTLKAMFEDNNYGYYPDYDKITTLDHGDYQGTKVYIIPEIGYQPINYFCVKVSYGSCSECDVYEAYRADGKDGYKESAPHMVTMALHMIESMKKI